MSTFNQNRITRGIARVVPIFFGVGACASTGKLIEENRSVAMLRVESDEPVEEVAVNGVVTSGAGSEDRSLQLEVPYLEKVYRGTTGARKAGRNLLIFGGVKFIAGAAAMGVAAGVEESGNAGVILFSGSIAAGVGLILGAVGLGVFLANPGDAEFIVQEPEHVQISVKARGRGPETRMLPLWPRERLGVLRLNGWLRFWTEARPTSDSMMPVADAFRPHAVSRPAVPREERIAIFPIVSTSGEFTTPWSEALNTYLPSRLLGSPQLTVISKDQLRRARAVTEAEDAGCRQKACVQAVASKVAATQTLVTGVARFVGDCVVAMILQGHRFAPFERRVAIWGGCGDRALAQSMDKGLKELGLVP